jgi:hypothetical protein
MPSKHAREAPELIEHALKHRVLIRRLPRVARPIQRRIIVRVGGRMISAITQHVSSARAAIDHHELVTVEVAYESSGSLHGASPGEVPAGLFRPQHVENFTRVKHCVR